GALDLESSPAKRGRGTAGGGGGGETPRHVPSNTPLWPAGQRVVYGTTSALVILGLVPRIRRRRRFARTAAEGEWRRRSPSRRPTEWYRNPRTARDSNPTTPFDHGDAFLPQPFQ